MKAKIGIAIILGLLSSFAFAADNNGINESNRQNHPKIIEVRKIYNEVEEEIRSKNLNEQKKTYEYSVPYAPTLKAIYCDKFNTVRKYEIYLKSDNSYYELDYNLKWAGTDLLSIQYVGERYEYSTPHPTNLFYTTNIDIKKGRKLFLKDLVKIDMNLVKKLKKGRYTPWAPGLNLESEGVLKDILETCTDERLIEYLTHADGLNNGYDTYSYFTKGSLGTSLGVSHAVGDHVEFEINYHDLEANLKREVDIWNGFELTHSPLIIENEKVLLSFQVSKSKKIMTLALSSNPEYIVYRFGSIDKIELEFPKDKNNSWSQFTYSYYFRGGGPGNAGLDLNYLIFCNGDYTYTVYQEYSAEDDEQKVGIRIKNKKGEEFEIEGNSASIIGSLTDLRFNDRIRIKELEG